LSTYFHDVDALTSGAHYFSDDHERQARVTRAPDRQVVLGCFGRIRPYKRFLAFGRAFGQAARPGFRLLVAGAAHSSEIHQELQQLERTYPCLTYLVGFLSEAEFAGALDRVDWVALPYERVYSSGVLVAAIQARKPILSPTPTGVEAYQLGPGLEAVDPWDDTTAVHQWMGATHRG
jgi:glycosyltransferase involved in cell wall biosynthesis